MNNNKKRNWAALAAGLILSTGLRASPILVDDTYIGADDHGHGDVIGDIGVFQVFNAEIDLVDTLLTVAINTSFAGMQDERLFRGSTRTYHGRGEADTGDGMGIGYGDLFLSAGDPLGGTAQDRWDFVLSLGNDKNQANHRWKDAGTAGLYRVDDATKVLTSEDFISRGTYRDGQEIAIDPSGVSPLSAGHGWTTSAGRVVFSIDIAGTGLNLSDGIGFRWQMSCGNDVIQGLARDAGLLPNSPPLPEPATPALMLFALPLLALTRRAGDR